MIQSPGNTDLSQFQQRLNQFKSSGDNISLIEAQQAHKMAKTLEPPAKEQALDLLKQEVTRFGSADAKAFYSLNPDLNLVDVLSALPPAQQSEGLKALSHQQPSLELETVLALPESRQQELLAQTRQALSHYQQKAEGMRSAVNPITAKAQDLEAFLEVFETRLKEAPRPEQTT